MKKKFSHADQLNQTQQRIYAIAWDISQHFRENWQGSKFKAQLVAPRKRIAILYKQYLDEIGIVLVGGAHHLARHPGGGRRSIRRDLERGGGLLEAHDG